VVDKPQPDNQYEI